MERDAIGRLIGVPDHDARADALRVHEIMQQPFHYDPADSFKLLVGEPYRLDTGNLDGCARRLHLRRLYFFVNNNVRVQTHSERTIKEDVTFGEDAGDLHPVEVFQASETAKTFATIRNQIGKATRRERVCQYG